MNKISYINPYVLNCGHTFEEEEAKKLSNCRVCGVEKFTASPNFALVALDQRNSDPRSEAAYEKNEDFENHEFQYENNELQRMSKKVDEINEVVHFIWGRNFRAHRARYYAENVRTERERQYQAFKEEEKMKPGMPREVLLVRSGAMDKKESAPCLCVIS